MNRQELTPELYQNLISSGFKYMALTAVMRDKHRNVSEFIFAPLREMPSSFSQSITSISDDMIQELVFGNVDSLHIHILPEEKQLAQAA